MTRLSRTERYRELREQMEEETTKSTLTTPEAPERTVRSAAPDVRGIHENDMAKNAILNNRAVQPKRQAVMDELLGEVKQYNIDRGQRVTEDTQINILEILQDEDTDDSRRSAHLEQMEESPMDVGGTTMRIAPTRPASEIAPEQAPATPKPAGAAPDRREPEKAEAPAQKVQPAKKSMLEKPDLIADAVDEGDPLDVFALGAEDMKKPESRPVEKLAPSRKDEKEARKAKCREQKEAEKKAAAARAEAEMRKQAAGVAEPEAVEEDGEIEEDNSSRFWNIVLVILIIILLIAIVGFFYAFYRTGLLG